MKNLKTIFGALLIIITLISCESKESVQSDIDKLRSERLRLRNSVRSQQNAVVRLNDELNAYNEKIREAKILTSEKEPQYIVKFELKQSRFSLKISNHIKDEMNAIQFEMPVSREFYNSIHNGQNIVDEFRSGSIILKGSFSKWKLKVINKTIR